MLFGERREALKLTESELQIMDLFWSVGKPLTSQDILLLSPKDKTWKDNSVFIMIKTLQQKKAIRETGAIKGEKGKYLRLFEPSFSKQEYYTAQLSGAINNKEIPALFSALIKDANLSSETISELEDILKKRKSEKN